jgi:hypothetical protein
VRRRLTLVGLIGALALAGGCGSDDSKSTTSSSGAAQSRTAASSAPEAGAGEKVLTQKVLSVKPSGTTVKLAVTAAPGSPEAYLTLSVKDGGGFRALRRIELSRPFRSGSTVRPLRVEQLQGKDFENEGGQGFVSWDGPTDASDYAEYFGWNVEAPRLELFGVAAG